MPNKRFGAASLAQYATLDPRLQTLADEVAEIMDFTIVEGFRGEAAQNEAFRKKLSQKRWPDGNHNKLPSKAMDVAPYPVDWSDTEKARQRFCVLAGVFIAVAHRLGIRIRWGGDWDGDLDTRDENFRDLPHVEVLD